MKEIFSIVDKIFKAVHIGHIGNILKFSFFFFCFLVKIFMVEVGSI